MPTLKEKIARIIRSQGPISVETYMSLCLFDDEYGYYRQYEPFGQDGDFITAPETSQIFGELIAAWLLATWSLLGCPPSPIIAEIGAGRGTLMSDIIRVFSKLAPQVANTASWFMIEKSARLRALQSKNLEKETIKISWTDKVEDLPEKPLFLIANELFDAIPMQQFIYTKTVWKERFIELSERNDLTFTQSYNTKTEIQNWEEPKEGFIQEIAPQRSCLLRKISQRISKNQGACLFIDYGYTQPSYGDTLQAIYQKKFDNPLEHPGQADLSSHVNFYELSKEAEKQGFTPFLTNQGSFLLEIGLKERLARLLQGKNIQTRLDLANQANRLVNPQEMGNLFKVFAFSFPKVALPGFTILERKG